jgi:uncharacterized protein
MTLNSSTKLNALLKAYPFLLDFLADYNPNFKLLKNKVMRATMERVATLGRIASIGGIPLKTLLNDVAATIKKHTGESVSIDSTVTTDEDADKLNRLRGIIQDLHMGVEFSEVKQRFDQLMSEIDPSEIVSMEEQLIREGTKVEEIHRLCDLHVSLFKTLLADQEKVDAPPGHPVHTYMEENKTIGEELCTFNEIIAQTVKAPGTFATLNFSLKETLERIAQIEKHYLRKENQLFPYLEKHGVTGPPKVMWSIHDEVRALVKKLRKAIEADDAKTIVEDGPKLSRTMTEMIFKEDAILFPMALETLSAEEWEEMKKGDDTIGYISFTPHATPQPKQEDTTVTAQDNSGLLNLSTGALSPEQVNLLLTHLPIEVSFVDENDTVRYYTDTKDRIFPRSPAVIGRKVQNCHPPKSLHIVTQIVEAFRAGTKDSASFWITMGGKFLLIRYFAVRDKNGSYKGVIEVTQDITDIKKLEGERRLLDWGEK